MNLSFLPLIFTKLDEVDNSVGGGITNIDFITLIRDLTQPAHLHVGFKS